MPRYVCIILFLMISFSEVSMDAAPVEDHLYYASIQTVTEFIQETEPVEDSSSDIVLFFGRFHPFLVHLPIGLLLFAFLLEFVSLIPRFDYLKEVVPFTLFVGILSGIAAGITGYLLSQGGGYSDDLLSSHKWLGIGVNITAVAVFVLRIMFYDHDLLKQAYRFLMVLLAGMIIATGHYGGSLTHGSDYLFRYMPETLQSLFGVEIAEEEEQIALIEDLDSARIYHEIIDPIIRTRCQSCHNYDRTEGELLLVSYDHIMAGSENGPVVVNNNAGESELFQRLILPDRDENRMPPRGRRQLTSDQIKLIGWWIDEGTPSTQTVSELEITDEIFDILHKLTVGGQSFYARTNVPAADGEYLDSLRALDFHIAPISEGLNFLQVRFSKSKTSVSKDDFALLLPLTEQVTWLDFSGMEVTDQELSALSEFRHLTRLNLSNTAIGDSTLEIIATLQNLEYLNVYATEVSDEGIQHLAHPGNLRSLYIWRTNVSREAVEELQSARPNLYINFGLDMSSN